MLESVCTDYERDTPVGTNILRRMGYLHGQGPDDVRTVEDLPGKTERPTHRDQQAKNRGAEYTRRLQREIGGVK
jgi:hypothetical protein